MQFCDALTLDAPKRMNGGFVAVRAKAARTGVYAYAGREVDPDNKHGLRDQSVVHVLRDEQTVFDETSARSFIGKPITDDHPAQAVTADNWRDHARGTVMGAMRDGEYLAFDLLLTDAGAIGKVDAGKRELSNGYTADLEYGSFTAADGTLCQARQTRIVGNHVALVDRGRAGGECAIKDTFAACAVLPSAFLDSLTQEKPVKTMLIDGLTVDVSNVDTAEKTIATILAARDGALKQVTDLQAQVATLTTDKATLDAEKVTLTQQLADASSPAKLLDAAKAYALVVDKAKALGVTVTDGMGQTEIIKAVVDAKIDASLRPGWTDAQYAASFASLTKDVKPAEAGVQPLGAPVITGDAATAYAEAQAKRKQALTDAWKNPAPTQAAN